MLGLRTAIKPLLSQSTTGEFDSPPKHLIICGGIHLGGGAELEERLFAVAGEGGGEVLLGEEVTHAELLKVRLTCGTTQQIKYK
eukprot:2421342-Pyramimonas_sp.AAC.2